MASFFPLFRKSNYSYTSKESCFQSLIKYLFISRNMYISKLSISFSLASLLVAGASACLSVSGMVTDGYTTQFEVTTTDDGTQTCSFTCSGQIENCDGSCISGYSATFDTGSAFTSDPGYLTYNTPHGSYGVSVPITFSNCLDCCGGNTPCTCCQVDYAGDYFGC